MAAHRPTARLDGDVFPDEPMTPDQVARAFWSDVTDWVHNGYQPVVTVVMEDGTEHEIDLEKVIE